MSKMSKMKQQNRQPSPFGVYLRRMRQQARLTFDMMAEITGISRGCICDLEYGFKSILLRQHWGNLVASGLGVTWSTLEEMEARSTPTKIDLRSMPEKDLLLALQLLRWIRAGKLPPGVHKAIREAIQGSEPAF